MSKIKYIETDLAAKPLGHYSQGIIHNETIYVATQLGNIPGKEIVVGTIEEQTEAALNNVRAILNAAGSDINKILKVTIYVVDSSIWERVNAVYAKFMGDHKPARGTIPTGEFHKGFQVAIDVIAAL